MIVTELDVSRFWSKVGVPDSSTGCLPWIAYKNRNGYGQCWLHKEKAVVGAHRVSYVINHGEIPAGLVIDHLCRNTGCVHPDHLEAVTQTENILRGVAAERKRSIKVCVRGHDYTPENTYRYDGRRGCKICRRDHVRAWRERKKKKKQ